MAIEGMLQVFGSTQGFLNECYARYPALRSVGVRSAILFTNFFLIVMALYQLKPASRSLFIDSLGVDKLPYVWIGTALTMGIFISYYHRLVERYSRIGIVIWVYCRTDLGGFSAKKQCKSHIKHDIIFQTVIAYLLPMVKLPAVYPG